MTDRVKDAVKSIVNTSAWEIICEEFIQPEILELYSLDSINPDDTALNLKSSIRGNKLAASKILDLVARMNALKANKSAPVQISVE